MTETASAEQVEDQLLHVQAEVDSVEIPPTSDARLLGIAGLSSMLAACGGGGGGSTPAPPALPQAPANPASVNIAAGAGQVSLNWTAVPGAEKYEVKRATVSGGPYTVIASPATAQYVDTSTVAGTTYYYVVSSVNAGGSSANSEQKSASPATQGQVPSVPTGLTGSGSNAQVQLSWGSAAGAASYQVKRALVSGGAYAVVGSVSTTSYTDTGLANGTAYTYVVAATNSTGNSGDSTPVSVTPNAVAAAPAVPTRLAAVPGNGQIALSWLDSAGAQSYQVKRSASATGPFAPLATTAAAFYTDATVTNGVVYYYVVSATANALTSADSTSVGATGSASAGGTPPGGLVAVAGNAQVQLSWNATAGASSYQVKRSTVSGGPYALAGTTTTATFTDTGLTNAATYYYVVVAIYSTGASANSLQVSATPFAPVAAVSQAEAARFLLQAQFSSSDAEISNVRTVGYAAWLQTQITSAQGQTGTAWLDSKGYNVPSGGTYFSSSPADYMVWNQLITAPDAPRKRMALALSEIFVTSTNVMDGYWPSYLMSRYWDILNANAFGNYRTLLDQITLNLAMGRYLNTRGNKKADGNGSAPDENYAREVMQLFSIGLVQLNPDGTPKRDGSGATIDSYSNADITELAKVFTGFDTDNSQNVTTPVPRSGGGTDNVPNTLFTQLPMAQVQSGRFRSTGTATFLGTTVPDVFNVTAALKTALDTLFNHPNNPPFISKQLIQRLVTSNPSPAYVQRVTNVYINNGKGVRGDLGAVYSAILSDAEARSASGLSTTGEFGKVREPMLRLVQWARTFNVTSTTGDWKIGDLSNPGTQLGQSPLRAPSVFNFFRPGYVPAGTALSAGAVAPEFQLVNESTVAGYLNYMQNVIDGGINSSDIKAAYTTEIALAESPTAAAPSNLINRLNLMMTGGQLSAATIKLITDTVGSMKQTETASATNTATNLRRRVCAAVLMVMASSEYLVQK